ncbi:MAG: hypothetical protein A2664_04175 [Candidatus Taylorbacteria bacterium RIFCSPHIGHO2_01_FULL_46_22b]|uniref:Response regulatory domain-containing protein n=1 Tax=Candidatus Taylorbacteria bacterium RIFCSPHIGHO2_01_FULL_46_22b TaxID=1802301 RepID=A0A1G2M1S7_9BACT|nr:MAG: hypothetical protein A2664_04175 [Candidatus Taylorbacteria bacterium RIFCSPHIGHO2_01_FULL_46_22b]
MNILVVDDIPLVGQLIREMLEELGGHRVTVAEGKEHALQILEESHREIDTLITDLNMPKGIEGWELIQLVRVRWPHVGCVLMSGRVEQALELIGGSDTVQVLAKPVRFQDFSKVLKPQISEPVA